CSSAPDAGWTIVKYIDTNFDSAMSAELAQLRLGNISNKQSSPPLVQPETPITKKRKPQLKNLAKQESRSKADVRWPVAVQEPPNQKRSAQAVMYSRFPLLLAGVGVYVVGIVAHQRNSEKRTTRLFYELDDAEQQKHSLVQETLTHLGK